MTEPYKLVNDQIYKLGQLDEQKRIIKLLEEHCDNNDIMGCKCAIQIALIKGENK